MDAAKKTKMQIVEAQCYRIEGPLSVKWREGLDSQVFIPKIMIMLYY